MASFEFDWNPAALEEIELQVDPIVELVAERVAEDARSTARQISAKLADAIVADGPHRDTEGVYADVGYDKTKPGFVLWWHEVGTSRYGASPHLRPAASRKVI